MAGRSSRCWRLVWGLVTPERRRGGVVAGMAIAASLAIGVEMLPYLALGGAAGGGGLGGGARRGRAVALAVRGGGGWARWRRCSLFIPPAQRFGVACDALSGAYVLPLLAGCSVLGVGTLRTGPFASSGGSSLSRAASEGFSTAHLGFGSGRFIRAPAWQAVEGLELLEPNGRGPAAGRAVWLGAAAGAAGATLFAVGGGVCLVDPYHAVDPVARALWLDRVSEALPLVPADRARWRWRAWRCR